MSVKVMGLVWDLKISREEKFILLAYADHADHEGGSIYPKVSTIAEKTGYSKRSVQRITRLLEDSGYLVAVSGQKGGVGITAHWHIPMKDDKIAPISKGDNSGSERVTLTTKKGDTAMSPDPSLTIINPSMEDIKKLGDVGIYILDLVGLDYNDADKKIRAGINQLIAKYGERRLADLACLVVEDYPKIKLGALFKRIDEYSLFHDYDHPKEGELDY